MGFMWQPRIRWRRRRTCNGEQLHTRRELPEYHLTLTPTLRRGPARSAPNYLLLLSMAVQDLILVRIALRAGGRVCGGKPLAQLDVPAGRGRLLLITGTRKTPPETRGTGFATICKQRCVTSNQRHFLSDKTHFFKQSR